MTLIRIFEGYSLTHVPSFIPKMITWNTCQGENKLVWEKCVCCFITTPKVSLVWYYSSLTYLFFRLLIFKRYNSRQGVRMMMDLIITLRLDLVSMTAKQVYSLIVTKYLQKIYSEIFIVNICIISINKYCSFYWY